jgi:hypothetical protein
MKLELSCESLRVSSINVLRNVLSSESFISPQSYSNFHEDVTPSP